MARFLIELEHDDEELECAKVVQVLLQTGSHFLSNADWGCMDGEHKAWIIVDVETKEQACHILPTAFRSQAKIVSLNKFTLEEIEDYLAQRNS